MERIIREERESETRNMELKYSDKIGGRLTTVGWYLTMVSVSEFLELKVVTPYDRSGRTRVFVLSSQDAFRRLGRLSFSGWTWVFEQLIV